MPAPTAAKVEDVATSTESEETTDATADAATEAETESASSGSSKDDDDDDDGADAASISAYAAAGVGGLLVLVAIAIAIYLGTRKQRKTSGRWANISELGANVETEDVPPPPIVVIDSQDAQSPLGHEDIALAQKKVIMDAPKPTNPIITESPKPAPAAFLASAFSTSSAKP